MATKMYSNQGLHILAFASQSMLRTSKGFLIENIVAFACSNDKITL